MNALQIQLVLVVVLLAVNAAFAGSEMALINLRSGQIERLRERGRSGRALAELAADPNEYLSTIQIGITLAGFLASATAATAFAGQLAPRLEFLGSAARPTAIVVVTGLLTFATLVCGELAPKRIAMSRAEGWALAVALPLRWLAKLSRPLVWLLGTATNALVRLVRVDPEEQPDEVSDEELRDMLLSRAGFRGTRPIFEGAFQVEERVLREIMRPRRDVTLVPVDATVEEAVAILREAGHSRAPLADEFDDVRGMLHLNDLAGTTGRADAVARDVVFFPETKSVLEALRELQHRRQSIAIVVDEHGGSEGIVSLEDAVEELVGEIHDEFDQETSQPVSVAEDGSMTLEGTFPARVLPDIGVHVPYTDAATIAGIVLERLGRVPDVGDTVDFAGWMATVTAMDGRAIHRVELRPDVSREGRGNPTS